MILGKSWECYYTRDFRVQHRVMHITTFRLVAKVTEPEHCDQKVSMCLPQKDCYFDGVITEAIECLMFRTNAFEVSSAKVLG